jgi:hypothetical protein
MYDPLETVEPMASKVQQALGKLNNGKYLFPYEQVALQNIVRRYDRTKTFFVPSNTKANMTDGFFNEYMRREPLVDTTGSNYFWFTFPLFWAGVIASFWYLIVDNNFPAFLVSWLFTAAIPLSGTVLAQPISYYFCWETEITELHGSAIADKYLYLGPLCIPLGRARYVAGSADDIPEELKELTLHK